MPVLATVLATPGAALRAAPPLVPSPDDARGALRRELADPDYLRDDLVQRVLDWLGRLIDRGVSSAGRTEGVTWLVLTVLVLALLAVIGLALRRLRPTRRHRDADTDLLDAALGSAGLRARAAAALAAGDHDAALLDAVRAIATHAVEQHLLRDAPGLTAREMAVAVAAGAPDHGPALAQAAQWFDATCYGHRPASAAQVQTVLALADALGVPGGSRRALAR